MPVVRVRRGTGPAALSWRGDRRLRAFVPFGLSLALVLGPRGADAGQTEPLPPLDLGQTNILDGEGGPGRLLEIITFGSGAGRLADADGRSVPGDNDQQIISAIAHPILVSAASVLGAHPGMEVLVPVSYVNNGFAASGAGHDTGLGDVTVEPFLEWSGAHPKAGTVSARLALGVVAPTGDHHAAEAVDTGQGGWQVSPYLAVTWRVSARWELSSRAIYDWSGSARGQAADGSRLRLQAGDQFALNASASYALTPAWRAGLGGYLLHQIGPAHVDGVSTPDSLQRVFALGPVSRWQVGKTNILVAAYGEFEARNRPEGVSANVRLQHPF